MKKQPLISVIIPIYNVAQYLAACLDSVCGQTHQNLEIICINDGSTDASGDICDNYAKQDNRIRVIHKENSGLSDTRNVGIANSQGEFLMFLDSDDWLDENCIEEALAFQGESDLDIVCFTYVKEYDEKSVAVHPYDHSIACDESKTIFKRLFGLYGQELRQPEMADSLCSACMKLYRADKIRSSSVRFVATKEIGSYEDGLFNLQIGAELAKIGYLNKAFYHYRKTNTASLTSTYKKDLVVQWRHLFSIIEEEIEKNGYDEEYRRRLDNRVALSLIGVGLNETDACHGVVTKIRNIRGYISSENYRRTMRFLELRNMPIKWKVFFLFAKMRFASVVCLLLWLMKILKKRGIS